MPQNNYSHPNSVRNTCAIVTNFLTTLYHIYQNWPSVIEEMTKTFWLTFH